MDFVFFKKWISNPRFLFILYILVAVCATIHKYSLHSINNFTIFRFSFFHLISNQNLYLEYPAEYFDLFLYSPTFGLFIAPYAVMPVWLGVVLWNATSALLFVIAIRRFPIADDKKIIIYWFALIEFITCIQNSQTNIAIAALIILAFSFFEKEKVGWAALCICIGAFIKIYSLVGIALFLVYPHKIRFAFYMLLWGIFLLGLPLVVVDFSQLVFLYKEWYRILFQDHTANLGISLIGIIYSWFTNQISSWYIQLAGVVLFCLAYIRYTYFQQFYFRALLLSSILIWIVIFSHASESPTYIIAIAGVAIWYAIQDKKSWISSSLVLFAFLLTELYATDLIPKFVRETYLDPYSLKALPCVVIWVAIQFSFWRKQTNRTYIKLNK